MTGSWSLAEFHGVARQDFPGEAARDAPMRGHGGAIEIGDEAGGCRHRLLHVQDEMGNHVRFDRQLAIGKLLDEHGPQQGRIGRGRFQ